MQVLEYSVGASAVISTWLRVDAKITTVKCFDGEEKLVSECSEEPQKSDKGPIELTTGLGPLISD